MTVYNLASHDFGATSMATFSISGVTRAQLNSNAWLVYLERSSGLVFPLPGPGVDNISEYRLYWKSVSGSANLTIHRADGPGEEYSAIRIIRIEGSTVVDGQMALPEDLNLRKYDDVVSYFGL